MPRVCALPELSTPLCYLRRQVHPWPRLFPIQPRRPRYDLLPLRSRYLSFSDPLFASYPDFSAPAHPLLFIPPPFRLAPPPPQSFRKLMNAKRSADQLQHPITTTWTYSARVKVHHFFHVVLMTLEDSATPPFGPIDSSPTWSSWPFAIYANYFIRPSQSPSDASILFVKQKDSSLHLDVENRGLNRITRKDHYVFSKIGLRGAHNLIRIAEGDKWKAAFRTTVLTSFKLCSRTLRNFNLASNFYTFCLTMQLQGLKYQL